MDNLFDDGCMTMKLQNKIPLIELGPHGSKQVTSIGKKKSLHHSLQNQIQSRVYWHLYILILHTSTQIQKIANMLSPRVIT